MSDDESQFWSDGARTAPLRISALPLDDIRRARVSRRVTLVFYHREGLTTVELEVGRPQIVGRSEPADIVINDPSLSRQHARFTWSEKDVLVEDLGSTNGTRVNGEPITEAHLQPQDEVLLGGISGFVHVTSPRVDAKERRTESHDRLLDLLDDEVLRARTFGRPLALMMVRSQRPREDTASLLENIRPLLRPVDRFAFYASDTLELLLPELARDAAVELATSICALRGEREPAIFAGVAMFGERGTSAEALLDQARNAVHHTSAAHPVHVTGRDEDDEEEAGGDIVVASTRMRELYLTVGRLAKAPIPVLIHGETGTGKEVVARKLHDGGPRRAARMRSINCGAIPATLIESVLFGYERGAFTGAERRTPGVFEQAHGGTVFLDEVGELPAPAQAALLRVLETKQLFRLGSTEELDVDVRIIAATNRNLEAMCDEGRFRWDLLFRLNAMSVDVPPLRDRVEEIAPMADLFRKRANRANGTNVLSIDGAAIALLESYRWPGNVRELRNVIERAVVVADGDTIRVSDLSERVRASAEVGAPPQPPPASVEPSDELDFKGKVKRYETELILHAMAKCRWNQTEAAKLLRIPLRTLTHKLGAYGLRGRNASGVAQGDEEE